MSTPKYPHIKVKLTGRDGNAFFILAAVRRAAKGKISDEQLKAFTDEAISGDYDNLLVTTMRWFTTT